MGLLFNSKLCEGKVERAAKMLKVIWFSADHSSYHTYGGYIWRGVLVSSRDLKLWPWPFAHLYALLMMKLSSCDGNGMVHKVKHSCYVKWSEVKVAQSCLTLCDPMGYTIYGILQARILEWVAFPFSRGSSQPRDRTQISCIAGRLFTIWDTREATCFMALYKNKVCWPLI